MYGLYRAWFGGGTAATSNYPCLQDTFSPPDTVVRVGNEGEHQFVAHKGVLAAHSGYLKALLASAAATTTMTIPSSSGDGSDGGGGSGGRGGGRSSASASCSPFDPACAAVAAVTIGQSQRSQPVTSVSVSSVGGEAFAPLLNYMYTGRLEVTLDNVYSVLLATHLLHMPGALEQCRAALLRLRAPPALPTPMPVPASTYASAATSSPPGTGSILRPIPSRLLVGPPLCWPPTSPLYPPTAPAPASVAMSHLPQMPPSVLLQPTVPPSISVVAPGARDKHEQCSHYSVSEVSSGKSPQSSPTQQRKRQRLGSRSRTPEIVSPTVALPFVAAAAAAFTAFAVTSGASNSTRASSPSRSVSPAASSSVSCTHSPTATTVSSQQHNHKSAVALEREHEAQQQVVAAGGGRSCTEQQQQQQRKSSASGEDAVGRGRNNNSGGDTTSEQSERARSARRRARSGAHGVKEVSGSSASASGTVFSVVYDIACCDGPVRFHRVLNENYSTTSYGIGAQARALQPRNCQQPDGEELSSENDENGGPTATATTTTTTTTTTMTTTTTVRRGAVAHSPSDSSNDGSSNGAASNAAAGNCYTCGYCKHTFKSQYCYRKHAKRHLLPTRMIPESTAGDAAANGSAPRKEAARAAATTVSAGRREVRLLDLNVQYYPCKICGCKFPSYYFVHKHRKLCHANDDERQGAAVAADAAAAACATARDMVDAP
ncbi:hypothetical protein EAI_13666 [Harpegnathos saltator]|uniref:Uncharacterized protein n=1 Tax=Harpegnathos saltator TaxID=610380 RepID=E2C0W1_HARSA|nr:hypothetical protein EAI_13666 [Harpegnathos saltator]